MSWGWLQRLSRQCCWTHDIKCVASISTLRISSKCSGRQWCPIVQFWHWDRGSIPGLGRSPGVGNDNPLQSSCLKNPMDRGVWWATVHRLAKNQTQLRDWAHTCTCNYLGLVSEFLQFIGSQRAHQAPLSMGFSRQKYGSGFPLPSPGDLLDPGIKSMSPALLGRFFTTGPPRY